MKVYTVLATPSGFNFHKKIQELLNDAAKKGWELHTIVANTIILEKEVQE
ncbi:MAG: DUF4177 domain-containing protein [Asgard group archaeon]|nr:DUF4177 domain-containing protein [Asgard group archaeon]